MSFNLNRMSFNKFTYILKSLAIILLPCFCYSCIDDPIIEDDPNVNGEGNGYYLTFRMGLPILSREGAIDNYEQYDNLIETDNIRLLFFYANKGDENYDYFYREFKSEELNFVPITTSPDGSKIHLYVRIPIDKIENGEDFADFVRDNDFKIAALVNWPETPSLTTSDDIHKLHKISYDKSMSPDGSNDRFNTYNFLEGPHYEMGAYTTWYNVIPTDDDGSELKENDRLNEWLRSIWNPSHAKNPALTLGAAPSGYSYQHEEYGRYSDLWFLWNFGGADNIKPDENLDPKLKREFYSNDENNTPPRADETSSNVIKYANFAGEWENRNGKNLRKWITDFIPKEETEGPITSDLTVVNQDDPTDPDEERNYLNFKKHDDAKAFKIETASGSGQYYYGVRLPHVNPDTNNNKYVGDNTSGVFSFEARAVGTCYVTVRCGSSAGSFVIQTGTSEAVTVTVPAATDKQKTFTNTFKEGKIGITGGQQTVYIYNNGTTDLEVLQIEFIQGLNIYYTSRESYTQPIPMYGVQKYDKLANIWMQGTTFDLSNLNGTGPSNNGTGPSNYSYEDIYLLRSVAKVEINIPSNLNAHHVYLRCANHSARCEPVDVSTNTKDIWKDHVNDSHATSTNCEHFSLVGYTPFYHCENANSGPTQFKTFRETLAWYYGRWGKIDADGKLKIKGFDGSADATVEVPDKNQGNATDYPHIINPRIIRSDFIEFHKVGSSGGYDRFVLYVGEKFVDDPNNIGKDKKLADESPKVCHIEFRINRPGLYEDPFYNLDDDNCYRVYFTENGVQSSYLPTFSDGNDTWEKRYEQNVDNLKEHWPIIRNHWYKFNVADIPEPDSKYLSVDVKVLAWAKRDITVTW